MTKPRAQMSNAQLEETRRQNRRRRATPEGRRQDADYNRVYNANRRAALYGASGRIDVEDVRAVLTPDARCAYCGSIERLTIDHIISLHAGGPNERSNLQACCHPCNASKFRNDAPGRWSHDHDTCQECSRTDQRHHGQGFCRRCYSKFRRRSR